MYVCIYFLKQVFTLGNGGSREGEDAFFRGEGGERENGR